MEKLLGDIFFTEKDGRALIIQTAGRYAVFYLHNKISDDGVKKKEELEKFLNLLSLITYLKYNGYISLYRSEKTKEKTMFFLQDAFLDPQPSTGNIVLNGKGDYTSNPEAIRNKNNDIIYKGEIFNSDTYDLIIGATTGLLCVSPCLRELIDTKGEIKATPTAKKMDTHIWINAAFLLLMCISFIFIYIKTMEYENKIDGLHDTISSLGTTSATAAAPQESEQYYYGIDISKWNGNIAEDIDSMDHISFIICKGTEGIRYVDPDFDFNWKIIKEKGFIRGAYHFYHTDDDPVKQAEYFWNTLQDINTTDIAPIVDIEEGSLPSKTSINKINLQVDLLIFLKQIETKSKRVPIIYTNTAFADKYLSHTAFSKYPLWLADYSKKPSPAIPKVWKQTGYKIWQKNASYRLDSETNDFDVYFGKKSDLYN